MMGTAAELGMFDIIHCEKQSGLDGRPPCGFYAAASISYIKLTDDDDDASDDGYFFGVGLGYQTNLLPEERTVMERIGDLLPSDVKVPGASLFRRRISFDCGVILGPPLELDTGTGHKSWMRGMAYLGVGICF